MVLLVLATLLAIGGGAALSAALAGTPTSPTDGRAGLARTTRQTSSLSTAQVAAMVDPAVVDINTIIELSQGNAEAAGTGMFISSNGYIVTNNHVVQGSTSIRVTVQGRLGRFPAHFVGADPQADVAVIKVDGLSPVPVVRFGNSSEVSVGEPVVAIGNALGLGGTPTVTTGTISALARSIIASDDTGTSEHLSDMIQTDAPIEPGNSGGPLLDSFGRVIGMNTAAASANGTKNSSLGFALPANRIAEIAAQIEAGRAGGGVELGLPAFLGIDGQNVDLLQTKPAARGVDIVNVVAGTPAAKVGIQQGDVIIRFDGLPTPTIGTLAALIEQHHPGNRASVTFESGTGTHTATVHLAAGPAL